MAGLWEKFRVSGLAAVHALADRLIDLNSVGAVEQYIRDLENQIEDLQDASAEANGYLKGLRRDEGKDRARYEELDNAINALLTDTDPVNDTQATPLEARLMVLDRSLKTRAEEVARASETASQLSGALNLLETKRQSMLARVEQLKAMEEAARAKEQAAQSIQGIGKLASTGAEASVDSITERIQRRSDVADEKLQQAVGAVNQQFGQDETVAEVQARLTQRKARLQAEREAQAAAAGSSTAGGSSYTVTVEPRQ